MANSSTGTAPAKGGKTKYLSTMAMMLLIVTTVISLRGLASQAEYGYTSIFYYLFAAIVFLVPFSLVCAELASTYTGSGGLFRWCSEAFGPRWGWAAMYFEWQCLMIWFPAVLMFGAVALAYVWWPETFDANLANNKWYTLAIVLGVYWLATLNTFRGQSASNKLSAAGGLFGTIIPGAVLIIMGIVYLAIGGHNYIDAHAPFFPDFSKFSTIVLAASIFLFFGGMEMNAVHVNQMQNPAKQFPKAIFMAVAIIVAIFVFGTLAIGYVIPQKDINLLASLLYAYNQLFASIHMEWLGNIIAAFITFGVIGQVSVIIDGPSTGVLAVGRAGYLPRKLQGMNKHGIQVPLLLVQGAFVTILSLVLVVLPSVQSAYQILGQMSTIIYLLMVLIIYAAFLRLRRTEPTRKRGFRVPGGNFGKWLVSIVGIAGALIAIVLSCVPPAQIATGSPVVYVAIVILGTLVFCAIPFIVFAKRKPEWHDPATNFEPFFWEIEGRTPAQKSAWKDGFNPSQTQVDRAMQWEDGELGPVSMKTVGLVNDAAVTPHLTADEKAGGYVLNAEGLPVKDTVKDTIENIKDKASDMNVSDMLKGATDKLGGIAGKASELAEKAAATVGNVGDLADKVPDSMKGVASKVADVAKTATEKVADIAQAGADKAPDQLKGVAGKVADATKDIADKVSDAADKLHDDK